VVVEFRVLGPLEVHDGDRVIAVRTAKARTLLVALLLRANRVVTIDELVDQLWDDSPPANPRSALQTNVQRLRGALGDGTAPSIQTRPSGYSIDLEPKQLDLLRFRELVGEAQRAEDPVRRHGLLSEALALWRGQPLAGVSSESLLRDELPLLLEEQLSVREQALDVRLELGQHAQVVAELAALTSRHPLRERLWGRLMLALYRCGRQGDALNAYRKLAGYLAEELGVDPDQELQRLRHAILVADPSLTVPAGSHASQGSPWSPQCQLPLDIGDFVGRADLVDQVEGLLARDTVLPIVWVSGSPGVGKSALAVRVGHRLRTRYPDGQWYVRLGGATTPRDPGEVLAELLRTCGVERGDIPERLDARAAAFRARLADRRLLLLLDDAAGSEQVEPLLPGIAGCAVLVTSRQDLSGLTARYAARGIVLDVLGPAEARALLARVIGIGEAGAEAAAVAELAELCAYLPLALRIAAANLASRPGAPLDRYVADLRTGNRLSGLALAGDGSAAVRTAFDHSYAGLRPAARRLFRLLGLIPGPDFTAEAAAALLGVRVGDAGHLLDVLAGANLLQRHATDRYLLHDLLRLYAAEQAQADPERQSAWRRLCDWYLRTADAAVQFDHPAPVQRSRPIAGGAFTDADQAQTWLGAERANLVAAIVRSADTGPHEFAWRLAGALRPYLQRQQHLVEWTAAAEAGLRAAEAVGDRLAQAAMHHSLGVLDQRRRGPQVAIQRYQAALERYREAGFDTGQATALCDLGFNYFVAGDMARATAALDHGIRLIREQGLTELLCGALNSRSIVLMLAGELAEAWRVNAEALETELAPRIPPLINRASIRRLLGQYDLAAADVDAALALSHKLHERRFETHGHDELARIWLDAGQVELAYEHAERTLRLARHADDAWCEAGALITLGDLYRLRASLDQADASYNQALRVSTARGLAIHQAEAQLGLAATCRCAGQPGDGLERARLAMDFARGAGLRVLQCQVLYVYAAIRCDQGERAEAARCLSRARRIQDQTGYRPPAHLTPSPR
jgi:DNA-binding SARP family transcriptional activator